MSRQSEIAEARDLLKTVRGFERRNPRGVVQKNRTWLESMVVDAQKILEKHGATVALNSATAGSEFIREVLREEDGESRMSLNSRSSQHRRLTAAEKRICDQLGISKDTFLAAEEPEGL